MTARRRATTASGPADHVRARVDGVRLVDGGWEREFDDAMSAVGDRLRIICPFIKRGVVERLLAAGAPQRIEVLTRYDTRAFCDGASDVEALALLLDRGASVRGVKDLHAKVYLFGRARAVVTSANLTRAALRSNHEFGFVSDDPEVLARCERYFEELWARVEPDLTSERIAEWRAKVERCRAARARGGDEGLGDEGVDVALGDEEPPIFPPEAPTQPSFVKLFGEGAKRADRTQSVRWAVERTGCHWACTYPPTKRPRRVADGSIMFMAYLVSDPDDIVIFGRAVGRRHRDDVDVATADEIRQRDFKEHYRLYVRVHDSEFVSGTLKNGVSLGAMMRALGTDSFASTQRRAAAGETDIDPRRSVWQQAQMELTRESYRWIAARLEAAIARHGRLSLAGLDWPPSETSESGAT